MAAHSVYSFSASDRWMKCPAAIRMSAGYPNTTNDAAELGTAVHMLGEFCIKIGCSPKHCIGMKFNGIVVTEKMAEDASLYRNFSDNLTLQTGVKPLIEQRVVMSSLGRTDVYGTSDLTHIALSMRKVFTSDYKNGYGLVDVNDNSQLAGYSVATLDTFDLWDKVDEVVNTIIQPNYHHIDGPIRSVVYTIPELRQWQQRYAIAVKRAEDPNEKPVAGEHCHYCPAQANCRARLEYALNIAYTDVPLNEVSVGELERLYSEVGSVETWLKAIKGRMLTEARNGVNFKAFKLVESYSRANVDDVAGLVKEAAAAGVDVTRLYHDPKVKGKTECKKFLPANLIDKYFKVPPKSTTVVDMTDNRPAVRVGKAEGIFAPIDEPRPSAEGIFGAIV
jgi:hypothetical protein